MRHEYEEHTGLAATAAVVVAGAAVAGTVMQATAGSGGGGGGGGASALAPGLRERLFNRTSRDMLDAERSILDDSLAQGKQLEPAMYAALGLEPIYDRPEDTGYADASNALNKAQSDSNSLREQRAALQASKPGKGLRGKAKTQAMHGKKREMRRLTRATNLADRQTAILSKDVEQRGAVGRRIVGFKSIAGVADPTGSSGGAFGSALDSFNLHLSDALAGKEPLDPTLKSSFDERERNLRQRLLNQMGPDYETSTAGSQALANFDRERSEAYAAYNRQSIEGYAGLSERRASALADLTTGRLKNLAFPADFRAQLGKNLESAANARNTQAETMQRERGLAVDTALADQAYADRQAQRDAERQSRIGGALAGSANTLGGVVTTYGGKLDRYLRGTAATPSTSPNDLGTPATAGLIGYGGKIGNAAALGA